MLGQIICQIPLSTVIETLPVLEIIKKNVVYDRDEDTVFCRLPTFLCMTEDIKKGVTYALPSLLATH